jgi:hypothetical protein
MPEFLRHGRQWNPGVVTSATPFLRSFCNSRWNLALTLMARALQIPKQVLIRFPVAVSEEILGRCAMLHSRGRASRTMLMPSRRNSRFATTFFYWCLLIIFESDAHVDAANFGLLREKIMFSIDHCQKFKKQKQRLGRLPDVQVFTGN